mgnify:CR=1 FL=1
MPPFAGPHVPLPCAPLDPVDGCLTRGRSAESRWQSRSVATSAEAERTREFRCEPHPGGPDETDIPAQEEGAPARARISGPHGQFRRSQRAAPSTCEGTPEAHCLVSRVPKIKRNREFQSIFRNGKIWSNDIAVLYLTRGSADAATRLGICVSKKLGKATVRNRIKRLISEACRLRWSQLRCGLNLIVLARRGVLEKPYAVVERSLDDLFRRARVVVTPPAGG